MTPSPITIFIADDHPIVRSGLRQVIEKQTGFEVVGEASDGSEALEKIIRLRPAIALLDLKMPGLSGIAVASEIADRNLPVSVIILTVHDEEELFRRAVEVGVRGYILKEMAINEIVQGVTVVARGDYFFSPMLAGRLLAAQVGDNRKNAVRSLDELSTMERKVLRLIAEYKSTAEIGEELFISGRTVEHHREHICRKLNVSGRYALVRFALEHHDLLI